MNFTPETIEKASNLTSSAWPEKTRVYTLAKNLGLSSRELIEVLANLQISKRAQSNVSPDQVTAVLDYIAAKKSDSVKKPDSVKKSGSATKAASNESESAANTDTPQAAPGIDKAKPDTDTAAQKEAATQKEAEEKLRHRVRKNVENEINQIAQKVDADLPASSLGDEPAPAPDVPAPAEPTMNAYVPVFRAPDVDPALDEAGLDEAVIDDIVAAAEHAEDATGDLADDFRDGMAGDADAGTASDEAGNAGDGEPADMRGGRHTNSRGRRRRGRRGGSRGRGVEQQAQDAADKHAEQSKGSGKPQADDRHSDNQHSVDQHAEKPDSGKYDSTEPNTAKPNTAKTDATKPAAENHASEKHASEKHTVEKIDEPRGLRGPARLEAQRRRRNELREETRKTERIVSESEFQERRAAITRKMVVCERERMDGPGTVTQLGLLEDDVLVEHFVNAENQGSMIGNIYLGRVENVLRNMEAAFIDIGQGRNAVLYAGEVDWKARGLNGRQRRIEAALKPGDQVLVQVMKDPLGHKGARLTAHISFSGRYLVYVPGGNNAGISRKLPAEERRRLKEMLDRVVPEDGGTIIRTAAEGVPERAIAADVDRMHNQWLHIKQRVEEEKEAKTSEPVTLFEEPDMLVKVVRDLFNEDYSELIVDGDRAYEVIYSYVKSVAPDLLKRISKHDRAAFQGQDSFTAYHIDEQIEEALSRNVSLPSGGSLVIDRTEAMIVIDVNTGKFTGKRKGGNLEETVTRNNLEAVDEIVRQIRLRDLGGMIVIDFIDMILEENQDLVLRRLKERLTSDRSRHQVSEVTSLGLVQLTRKRIGTGLLEAYATDCPTCAGRGLLINSDPVDALKQAEVAAQAHEHEPENGYGRGRVATLDDDGDAVDAVIDDEQVDAQDQGARKRRERERAAAAEFENLAASVIGKQKPDSEVDTDSTQEASRKRGKGRRKKRVVRASHTHASGSHGAGSHNAGENAAGGNVADQKSADSAAHSGVAEKSYEQAVEEFESSPRRRRRTRGNSRSDHRPRKKDFRWEDRQATAAKSTGDSQHGIADGRHENGASTNVDTGTDKQTSAAKQTNAGNKTAESAVRKSSKRRRVVRRISSASGTGANISANGEANDAGQQASGTGAGDGASVDKNGRDDKQDHGDKQQAVRKGTRRRRVVRRPAKK